MSLFDRIGQQPAQGQPMTQQQMMQMQQRAIEDIKKDPHGMIQRAGLNVPENMTDPRQMAQYLIDSGQVGGPRLQMARGLMARLGLK